MANFVVTGARSGIGAATARRLSEASNTVVGVDIADVDVTADLSTSAGRASAVAAVTEACGGVVHGVVCCAGLGSLSPHPGGRMVAVNYYGAVDFLSGLRPALGRAGSASAVVISSSSTTTQPGIPQDLVTACLERTEEEATALGESLGALLAYPATKLALAWWVRREAVQANWIGEGIRLNAIAPGMIDTPMTSGADVNPDLAKALDYYPVPMGRRGRPEEIASVADFLLGPGSSLLCGSVLFADGGTDAVCRPTDWPAAWTPSNEELARLFT